MPTDGLLDVPGVPDAPSDLLAAPAKAKPLELRRFDDPDTAREWIYQNAFDAAATLPPVSNQKNTLELHDVHWLDKGNFSKADRKKQVLTGGSLGRRLRGTWVLKDNVTGKELDRKTAVVASIPHLTDSGTFVRAGTEYGLRNQQRLRAGVFARQKQDGTLEAHVAVLKGGPAHRYELNPENGVFYLTSGQARIPLLPLLQELDPAKASKLGDAWGQDVFNANQRKADASALTRLTERFDKKGEGLKTVFERMTLDPEVTRHTLGHPHARVDFDTIAAATRKLLDVGRGKAQTDDRDHLAYQQFVGPEDLIAERIAKDRAGVRRQLLFKATNRGNLQWLPAGALQGQVDSAFDESGLGEPLQETNLLETHDKMASITKLGEGGIQNMDSIPDESRSVQPSHAGFIDLIRTPECYDEQTEVMTFSGWKKWCDVTPQDDLACLVNGQLRFHAPKKLIRSRYAGLMYGAISETIDYLVTPNHRMFVRRGYGTPLWVIESVERTHESVRLLLSGGFEPYTGDEDPPRDWLPKVERRAHNTQDIDLKWASLDDWAEFLGWYLAEGSYYYNTKRPDYKVFISQCPVANPDNCRRIEWLLDRMGLKWGRSKSNTDQLWICGKQLTVWAKQFGDSWTKFIPEYAFAWPVSARRRLLYGLMWGDGRKATKGSHKGEPKSFCSSSRQLALDVQRLAFGLGTASRLCFEPDDRQPQYAGCYVVFLRDRRISTLTPGSPNAAAERSRRNCYYTRQYDGMVYCAEVPGGLLYVRRNNSIGFWCGNSSRAGVDLYFASSTRKGNDGNIYSSFVDPKTGKAVLKTPRDIADLTVAFPGELQQPGKRVKVLQNGRFTYALKRDVDLVMPDFEHSFSSVGNLVPGKSGIKQQRMAMGSRMLGQALALVNGEAPLVRSAVPGTNGQTSYEEHLSNMAGAIKAKKSGTVLAVDANGIKVRNSDGTIETISTHASLPLNRKSFIDQKATVQPGQQINPGDLLARSNFTNAKGELALGLNARTAFTSWKGLNHADAFLISESMARRATSDHAYQHELELTDRVKTGLKSYVSLFPGKYDKSILANMTDKGMIKPGTPVKYGDPLILAAEEREDAANKLHRKNEAGFRDASITWDHHDPGVVTDVVDGRNGPVVVVRSQQPMKTGDKLSGRYGNKGVVHILPDLQMPHDSQGRPFEVVSNSTSLISRGNASMWLEAKLGQIAEKAGKHYNLADFDPNVPDRAANVKALMQQWGVPDTEDIIDPETGRKIPGVFTGNSFYMKLHHLSEDKQSGRGAGGGYAADESPAKGGASGSKKLSMLDMSALLSSGASEVLRDAGAVRGQRNDDYWLQYMQGHTPTSPRVPLVYQKFINQLKASGINVQRAGSKLNIMAMTNKDVDSLAGDRNVSNGQTVDFNKDLSPVAGGLFDEKLTGGHHSAGRWAAIPLSEPMPNPVMEDPIRHMLNLTKSKFEAVIAGREQLNGLSGPAAIKAGLENIDIDRDIAVARARIKGGSKSDRDDAVRKLGYLKSAKQLGIEPKDWMLNRVPVIPPAFRPVSVLGGSGVPLVSDVNHLYRELIESDNNYKSLRDSAGADAAGDERLAVYNAFKAVTGLGEPVTQQSKDKKVTGLLQEVFGNSPKHSTLQRKLLSSTVDNVGRATVVPNPDLDMDSLGLPEDKAFDVYQRFIVRRLKRAGMPLVEALRQAKEKSPLAKSALLEEMADRPVIMNRAPVLHRYGIMAFKPQLVKGSVVHVPPLVIKGLGMDFDGDAVQYHVPVDPAAVAEAMDRLLPSRQLIAPADMRSPVHTPQEDYVAGLHAATTRKTERKHTFRNAADVRAAWQAGRIDLGDMITLLAK